MAELLFEIFCEEIPARMQVRAGQDLQKALTSGFEKAGITPEDVQIFTGPRRLTFVADIPLQSPDVTEERKGPKVGAPEQALAGFMRGVGIDSIDQAEIREDKKGQYYVAVTEKKGVASADILTDLIPSVMNNFPWPKSMKTAGESFRWVRPLQSMICLFDGAVIPVLAGGITAGNITEGHRRHGRGPFTVTGFADYRRQLEGAGHVLLSHEDRKSRILGAAKTACEQAGLELVEDEGLLNEVAGLAEWPIVILGDMDPEFLKLPGEVIRLSMRTHQKYFAVRDPKSGSLAPNFIVVANQDAPDGGAEIARGNSRVLSARLADAVFFQSEDAKKPLIDYFDKLDTVVFHKKLGSVKDKAERVAALAREIAPKVGADPDAAELAAKLAKCDLVTQTVIEFTSLQGQIGRLMYERENALSAHHSRESGNPASDAAQTDGLDPHFHGDDGLKGGAPTASIARAIEEHYKPQGPSDAVPTDPVSIAVALADKLDTLVGFWAIDEKPTGSKDPYALRRAALGVVRIILENEVRLQVDAELKNALLVNIRDCARDGDIVYWISDQTKGMIKENEDNPVEGEGYEILDFNLYNGAKDKYEIDYINKGRFVLSSKLWSIPGVLKKDRVDEFDDTVVLEFSDLNILTIDLLAFILDRLKGTLRDQGLRHDLIDAVYALGGDDLLDITRRVTALQSVLATDEGANLIAGYKRAANILRAEDKKGALPDLTAPIDTAKLSQGEERDLYAALQLARPKIDAALSSESYSEAMTALSNLRAPVDAFFDKILVNDDDADIRANRLRLLALIRDTASAIADFDQIDG